MGIYESAGVSLDATLSQLANKDGQLSDALSMLTTEVDALEMRIAALEQASQPQPEPPKPEPPKPSMIVGTSLHREETENYQQAYQRRCDNWKVCPEGVRYFGQNPYPEWPDFKGVPLWTSFKIDPFAVLAGTHNDALANAFSKAPTDRDTYWAFWHEPEDDIEGNRFTAKHYRDATAHIHRIYMDGPTNLRCRFGVILMGWTVQKGSGRTFTDYVNPGLEYDFVGFDVYPAPTKADIDSKYGLCAAAAASIDASCVITETGPSKPNERTPQETADLVHIGCETARRLNMPAWLYFDSTVGGDFRLNTQVEWDAIAAEIKVQ